MNKETIITAIVTLIVAIFDLLKIWNIYVPIESDGVYTVVSAIVFIVCYWRNQSWTPEGWAGTLIGRDMKKNRLTEAETVKEPTDSEVITL